MQTGSAAVYRYLAWEQSDLPNDSYRIENARWVDGRPDLTGWVDCTAMGSRVIDEIEAALTLMGEAMRGEWVCWGNTVDRVCHGIAWMI